MHNPSPLSRGGRGGGKAPPDRGRGNAVPAPAVDSRLRDGAPRLPTARSRAQVWSTWVPWIASDTTPSART